MALVSTKDVERRLSHKGFMPLGVDLTPRSSPGGGLTPTVLAGMLEERGWGRNASLGMAANAAHESGGGYGAPLNPGAIGDNKNSIGLFQLNGPRRIALQQFASSKGKDWKDVSTQLDYLDIEIARDYPTLKQRMNSAPTAGESARMFLTEFERPADLATNLRVRTATAQRLAGERPSFFGETVPAALRRETGVGSLIAAMDTTLYPIDPDFDPIGAAAEHEDLMPYLDNFVEVRNRDEFQRRMGQIRTRLADDDTLAAAGWQGIVASVGAGFLDPINLVPIGGGAWKALRAGRLAESALTGISGGLIGAGMQEALLSATQPTRTAEESVLNVASGGIGGAGLGVGAGLAGETASRAARSGYTAAGGAAGGAVAGGGVAAYSGQSLEDAAVSIGTGTVILGLLGGSVGAMARPGVTAKAALGEAAARLDIETDAGNGAVYQDVRSQLLNAGRPEAEADAGGSLWQAHIDAMARVTGQSQEKLYRALGLDVRTGALPEGALMQSGDSRVAPKPSAEDISQFAQDVMERNGLQEIHLSKTRAGDLNISMIEVAKGERKLGIGSKAIREITEFADEHGMRVTLTPGLRDERHGTTSRSRLIEFYKQFGFVENKGRNKDFSISDGMYREPKALARPTSSDLPMDEASRMARAREQGFSAEVYHGSQAVVDWMDNPDLMSKMQAGENIPAEAVATREAISEFRVRTGGLKLMDGIGVHAGTVRAAEQRLESNIGVKFGTKAADVRLEDSYVMPLYGRAQKPFVKKNGEIFTETELQSRLTDIAVKLGFEKSNMRRQSGRAPFPRGFRDAQKAVRKWLIDQGHDAVPYINSHEDRGSVSWIFLDPSSIRSRFAKFDPTRALSADLLAQDARGAVELTPSMARVTLSAKADASTFLHESGHIFLDHMDRLAKDTPELAADAKVVREWLGVGDDGPLTVDAQEKWARGFEAYLRDGKAPTPALARAFEMFKQWLTAIYRTLADLDVELSDDVRAVMDRMLGVGEDRAISDIARSLSAAATPLGDEAGDLRIARGLEWIMRAQAGTPIMSQPDMVLATSPVTASRRAMRRLVQPFLATVGDLAGRGATENVHSNVEQWRGRLVVAAEQSKAVFRDYSFAARKAGEKWLNYDDFRKASSGAGRRGDSADRMPLGDEAKKAVAKVAAVYRREVFDPPLAEAIRHGLMTQAQVDAARRMAESYIPRDWNIPMIVAQRDRFTREVVLPRVHEKWEEAKVKLDSAAQISRFTEEQFREVESAGRQFGGPEAAAFIAEGPPRDSAQMMRDNIKAIEGAYDDPSVTWHEGDETRARDLIIKSKTPVIARDGMEGIRKGGPALNAVEAEELQNIVLRTLGMLPGDAGDSGARAARAVQAMKKWADTLKADGNAEESARVAAIANAHDTQTKKSLAQRAKAQRTLTAEDHLGRLDETDLRGVASDIVEGLVGHETNRIQYEGIEIQQRGPMKEITFDVRDTMVEEWLENDIEVLAQKYIGTMAPDVELKRLTGGLNGEPLRQAIVDEYNAKMNGEPANLPPVKEGMTPEEATQDRLMREKVIRDAGGVADGKEKTRLNKRMKADLEAFDGIVSRLRGTYGMPRNTAEVWGLRAGRVLKSYNFMRLMGGNAITQITDLGRIIFMSGMSNLLGDAIAPMVSNWKAVRLTKAELHLADIATEVAKGSLALRGAEIFDDYGHITAVERGMQKGAAAASTLFGLNRLNQGLKTIAGLIAQAKLADGVKALASGEKTLKPLMLSDLNRAGIGPREAELLQRYIEDYGKPVHGVMIPNTKDWSGDDAADAARLWRSAMRQLVDDQIVNPGQDRPLWMSRPLGSVLGQLETFNLISTQRTILVGLQRRNAAVVTGSAAMIGLGMLQYWIVAQIAGWDMPEDWGDWLGQGIKRSGLLGVLGSAENRLSAGTRGAVSIDALTGSPTKSRYAAAGIGSFLGPSGGLAETALSTTQAIGGGDWNWINTHRLRSLVPPQNFFIVRGAFDDAEKRFNAEFGIKNRAKRRRD